jgi:hypothetical protein
LETFLYDSPFPSFEDVTFFLEVVQVSTFDSFAEYKIIPPVNYPNQDNDNG